jgi:thiamine biosynthesis lipoprotein
MISPEISKKTSSKESVSSWEFKNVDNFVMNYWKNISISGVAIIVFSILGCKSGKEQIYKETKIVMGTLVEITVAHESEVEARLAISDAMLELQRSDDLMSHYKSGSLISKLNRAGAKSKVHVGEEVFQLLRDAVSISRASRGAFDVTILPVEVLWGFDSGGRVPTTEMINEKLPLVGYEMIDFNDSEHSVGLEAPGMGVDLGGIAKGWAVDHAMEKITLHGIRNAIIDAGGDLRIIGGRPGKEFWRIGVQHPREQGALLAAFDLRDTAIVTSGDYERFFVADGVRYHHILDPSTGQPARGCQSVTVIAPTAAEADACATAAFVLGPEKGLAFLRSRHGVRGFIVGADGALHWSDESLERMARR